MKGGVLLGIVYLCTPGLAGVGVIIDNALVSQVLETSSGRAPDMTRVLYSLRGGDIGAGIVTLWNAR